MSNLPGFKPMRTYWFLSMGLVDSFDYVTGIHPDIPDDVIPIEEWVTDFQRIMQYIELDREDYGLL